VVGFTVVDMDQQPASISPSAGDDDVLAALTAIGDQIARARDFRLPSRSDEAARDGVRAGFAVLQQLESLWLSLVADLDVRPDAIPKAAPDHRASSFLRAVLHRTAKQAAADVRAAQALTTGRAAESGGLPQTAEAFAAGQISRDHVDVAVATMRKIPQEALSRPMPNLGPDLQPPCPDSTHDSAAEVSGGQAVDGLLAFRSRSFDTTVTKRIAQDLIAALDPDGDDGFNPDDVDKRTLAYAKDLDGMVIGRFQLDPVTGAWVIEAIERFATPDPVREEISETGEAVKVIDKRSAAQRRADALGTIARLALGSADAGTQGGEPPRIVIHSSSDDLHDALHHAAGESAHDCPTRTEPSPTEPSRTEPHRTESPRTAHDQRVSPRVLGRLACGALLQAVLLAGNGAVLDLGRDVRLASRAQRRALVARDRGCVIPGCTAPASQCDAHHVVFFSDGGRSDIGNFVLACGRHHTEIHQGTWVVVMIDGMPWARPPAWMDSQRRLIRNTYHDAGAQARDVGTQLRLSLREHERATDRRPPSRRACPVCHPWSSAECPHSGGPPHGQPDVPSAPDTG
jgi:hypothetical protein